MIELLAAQIYPSPLALLRENIQNSFDAILLRKQLGHNFEPLIEAEISPTVIRVTDNGIGMSRADLQNHFWRAGSSSKNTPLARAAGVVGTFGIGARANFGIAEELTVQTESAETGERTWSQAKRSTLSVTEDCIAFQVEQPLGKLGTVVTATMQSGQVVNADHSKRYIAEFASFLPIKVIVNGELLSQKSIEESVPRLTQSSWMFSLNGAEIGPGFQANVQLTGAITGEVRIDLSEIVYGGQKLDGRFILRQGVSNIRTFRSLFGLASVSISSAYQFGGTADFLFLQPTAGREALTTDSMQALQRMVTLVDTFVSLRLAERPESNANQYFVNWAAQHRRFDLCSNLRVRVEPADSFTLGELLKRSGTTKFLVYAGTDLASIRHASEERPLLLVSQGSARRMCELGFLHAYCNIEELSNDPKVLHAQAVTAYTLAESALAFKITSILSSDYFLNAEVRFGSLSHGLPILVTRRSSPVEVYLDSGGQTVRLLLDLYEREYSAFGHMVKDFVRTVVFPRVSDLVPSATRQGAEAFLKTIQRSREVFEYEAADLESLTALWTQYLDGKLTMQQAANRSRTIASRSYQIFDSSATGSIRDIVPDVIENQIALSNEREVQRPDNEPAPPIMRLDIETSRKVLTISDGEFPLKGYRCFLALSDRIREEKGDFFLQPHRTSVVWGGQRALFIFEHHSGEFGLYYDIQTADLVGNEPGGGAFETCTIVMKNNIFIPIPEPIHNSFVPLQAEKKRLEIRCDVLYIDRGP